MTITFGRICVFALAVTWTISGCVTTSTRNGRVVDNPPSQMSKAMAWMGDSVRGAVKSVTPEDEPAPIIRLWAAGIPQQVVKAEEVPIRIDEATVSAIAPELVQDGVRLVSSSDVSAPWNIASVGDTRVKTFADLNKVVQAANAKDDKSVIELASGTLGKNTTPLKLDRMELTALTHTVVPDGMPVRVVEDGNSWILIKEGGIRCKVMLRREQSSGLIHAVVALKLCWGDDTRLPADVVVRSGKSKLNCLSVSDVLTVLYDEPKTESEDAKSQAYQDIAGSDEFVTPVNYRRLEAGVAERQRLASIRPVPAFAVVGGYAYPGPPVLGDARALSGFMLQPRVYTADETEHVGWVVFDGRKFREQEDFSLELKLGESTHVVQFRIPEDV